MQINAGINTLINQNNIPIGLIKGIVQYNNLDLTSLSKHTSGYMIETGNELSLNNINIKDFSSNITDGGTVINKLYSNKDVGFTLFIQGVDNADLITKIQSLKKELNAINGKLYITRNGVVYSYKATCTSVIVPDFQTTDDFVNNVHIGFKLTSPHGIIEETVQTQTTNTANFQSIINNVGNYKAYPKIILIGNATNNITSVTIDIRPIGALSGISITIPLTMGVGDILEIDYDLKTVILNGVALIFTGFLAPLQTGQNLLNFTFIGTVNIDTSILYNKTYL